MPSGRLAHAGDHSRRDWLGRTVPAWMLGGAIALGGAGATGGPLGWQYGRQGLGITVIALGWWLGGSATARDLAARASAHQRRFIAAGWIAAALVGLAGAWWAQRYSRVHPD